LAAVSEVLRTDGRAIVTTREPGATAFGGQIRAMLLHGDRMPPYAELFLFLADRTNHVENLIRPALAEGSWVFCDRYADSTLVYQAHGRGLDVDFVRRANAVATRGLVPHLTLLFDLPPEVGLARLTKPDRLDAEPLEFHRRVRTAFLELAAAEPARFRVVDADRPVSEVIADVLTHIGNAASSA
jgi:dTMP kinase